MYQELGRRSGISLMSLLFNFGLLFINPLILIGVRSFINDYKSSLVEQFAISASLALFFCNRQFGADLGGGAFDDVPQYVYLFQQATMHDLAYLLAGWSFEPGFIFITKIISLFTASPIAYLFTVFFITCFSIVRASAKIAPINPVLPLFFLISFFGLNTYILMHVLRQSMAFGFVMLAMVEMSEPMATKFKRMTDLALLIAGCAMHVSVIPIVAAFVVAKSLWTRSRWILSFGVIFAFFAPSFAGSIFDVISSVSTRLQGYATTTTIALISPFQLWAAGGLSILLIFSALRHVHESPFATLRYVAGILGFIMLSVSLFSSLPVQAVSRQLALILALLSLLIAGLIGNEKGSWLRNVFLGFIALRLGFMIVIPPPHLVPFQEAGALSTFNGALSNEYDILATHREIVSYLGWGNL